MEKSIVSIVRCETYNDDEVMTAVRQGIDLLGGMETFVSSGECIVLKPNILLGSSPEKGVTTHPAVFKAVGLLLQQAGTTVSYGDSSAFGSVSFHARRAGLKQVGDGCGFDIADFDSGRTVSHKDGVLIKQFEIANGALDADGLISLPRFKTHGLTRFTGAVKNQFGCIPGALKGQFHAKLPDPWDFSAMLTDLNMLLQPRLYIMDGIYAMEGNGPRNGKQRKMGVLLFSTDPVALDATACRMIDLDPAIVPTSITGEKAGLGTWHEEDIEVLGDTVKSFFTPDFDVDRSPVEPVTANRLMNMMKNHITPRPVINAAKCSGCGTCVQLCPVEPKAVHRKDGDTKNVPSYNYNRCIRCYCCQETCPEGAITVRTPLLAKLFAWV